MRTDVLRPDRRSEAGAVGILFAVLLGTGVLFGLVALTFDYGNLNVSHSQLQSSADAAALQAAKICATSDACPEPAALDAISQANDSGSSHASSVAPPLCGRGGGLPRTCTDDNGRITLCPQTGWAGNYVEVHTRKTTDDTVAGNGAGGSTEGQACAAVAWGPVGSYAAVLPITLSVCEWQVATNGDPLDGTGTYAPDPPSSADAGLERTIVLAKQTGPCPTFNGHDAPGGFGWLNDNDCSTTVVTNDWARVDTGTNMDCDLSSLLNKVVAIPVYDCMNTNPTWPSNPATQCDSGHGSQNYYHVAGYAGFYLSGWFYSNGHKQDSTVTGRQFCSKSERCLYGFFVKDVVPGGAINADPSAPDFGVRVIQTIG